MYTLYYCSSAGKVRFTKFSSLREVKSFIGDSYPEHSFGQWKLFNKEGHMLASRQRTLYSHRFRTTINSHYQQAISKASFV